MEWTFLATGLTLYVISGLEVWFRDWVMEGMGPRGTPPDKLRRRFARGVLIRFALGTLYVVVAVVGWLI